MNARIKILVTLLLLLSGMLTAQERVSGEALVQLKREHDIAAFVDDMNAELGLLAGVKSKQCVYERMGIWLVSFDETSVAMRDFIHLAKQHEAVAQAQVNHIIRERVIPNDPFFSQQWHHQQSVNDDFAVTKGFRELLYHHRNQSSHVETSSSVPMALTNASSSVDSPVCSSN
jgi:hypothetical protein